MRGGLFEAEPVEIGEMLFAGIGEGQAEIHKPGGKVCERNGDFLPGVPIAGWFHKGGGDVLAIRGDRYRRAIAGGGITERYFLTAFESKAVILGPMRVIDRSEKWLLVGVEDLGAVVRGIGLGLNGSGMEADCRSSGEWRSHSIAAAGISVICGELERLVL